MQQVFKFNRIVVLVRFTANVVENYSACLKRVFEFSVIMLVGDSVKECVCVNRIVGEKFLTSSYLLDMRQMICMTLV